MRNLAADLVEGQDRGWSQLAAIRDEFVNQGFYDVTEDTAPGHSYGRIAAMLEDPDRIVGFEEQYAAAAAVMAQVAELPVRVVVGYRIPEASWRNGRAEVTAGDIAAWIELDAGELGWIPVDVTPDRSRTPDPDTRGSTTEQVAIPNPPPPPPPPPQIEPPRQEEEAIDSEEELEPVEHDFGTGTGLAPWAVITAAVVGVPIALLAPSPSSSSGGSCCAAPAGAAGHRPPAESPGHGPKPSTAARRPAPRGSPGRRRRRRSACTPATANWSPSPRRCGRWPTRSIAPPMPPPRRAEEHADVAWRCSDELAAELRRNSRPARRVRMRLDPRPLFRDESKSGSRTVSDDRGAPPDLPEDDDDVTVPGDHELIAELRRSGAVTTPPPTEPVDVDRRRRPDHRRRPRRHRRAAGHHTGRDAQRPRDRAAADAAATAASCLAAPLQPPTTVPLPVSARRTSPTDRARTLAAHGTPARRPPSGAGAGAQRPIDGSVAHRRLRRAPRPRSRCRPARRAR